MEVQAIDSAGVQPAGAISAVTAVGDGSPQQPAAQQAAPQHPAAPEADQTLRAAVSQMMGSDVSVSFKVDPGSDQVVTVFSDASTGKVISQFPAESMLQIAQFFDKLAGAVLDRTA